MSRQVYESFSAKDTLQLGSRLGKFCKAGDVILLHGDLGVGKTVFSKGIGENRFPVLHLQFCRFMKREGFRFTILMYTGLLTLRRWKKSGMKIIFMGKESA